MGSPALGCLREKTSSWQGSASGREAAARGGLLGPGTAAWLSCPRGMHHEVVQDTLRCIWNHRVGFQGGGCGGSPGFLGGRQGICCFLMGHTETELSQAPRGHSGKMTRVPKNCSTDQSPGGNRAWAQSQVDGEYVAQVMVERGVGTVTVKVGDASLDWTPKGYQ